MTAPIAELQLDRTERQDLRRRVESEYWIWSCPRGTPTGGAGSKTHSPSAVVACTVLAAGRSTRMGVENKLLGDAGGRPMVRQVVEAALASGARPILAGTGHQGQ